MNIKEFIQRNIILTRLKKNGVLVVYDPDLHYCELCLDMKSENLTVIDARESSITSRELALEALGGLGKQIKGMLVYVPTKPPVTEEEKQRDPFALYTMCGNIFPESDGDRYFEICKKYMPDHVTEITRIFNDNPSPSFAVIDAIGGGIGWPNLQALLRAESARDILFALLAPNDIQKVSLIRESSWVPEARELLTSSLGLKLITRSNSWQNVSDELWRYLLFSEFVFDLPEELPDSLVGVPRANEDAKEIIEDLCDQLRNDRRTQGLYIDRAEAIERELDLSRQCSEIKNLGIRDTFPFEERSLLKNAINALKQDNIDEVRSIIMNHKHSVWVGRGESQVQWSIIRSALSLCEKCDDCERQLHEYAKNLDSLISFYVSTLREVDQLHREFEQSVSDFLEAYDEMTDVIKQARKKYRNLITKVQEVFIRNIEKDGYPPVGGLSNSNVFEKFVFPKLQESGYKVAYFLIDALRYELGVALEKQLLEDGQVGIKAAFAQLPTITEVGMASLLPEAGQQLFIAKEGNDILPKLEGKRITNVSQRMDILKEKYGQRFAEVTLSDFTKSNKDIPETVDLLVVRSNEIDSHLENSPETAIRLIYDMLRRIRVAINKLKNMGFKEAIIATDHGFYFNIQTEAGDVASKPAGNWVNLHERLLLGNGASDASNFVFPADQLGIRGEFSQVAGPRGLVPYRMGMTYFHGGISLQECIVPVLTIRLSKEQQDLRKPQVILSYKNGAKRITTRLPVIDLRLEGDLLSLNTEFEILLEAQDKKGNIVGEAKPGEPVNPATGTIILKPGESKKVTLKMNAEFEGKFIVKAMNPTTLVAYEQINLETDYLVV